MDHIHCQITTRKTCTEIVVSDWGKMLFPLLPTIQDAAIYSRIDRETQQFFAVVPNGPDTDKILLNLYEDSDAWVENDLSR